MFQLLPTIVVLLAAAVLAVALFRRWHLPALLGYLLVGILVGPKALGLAPESAQTQHLAEFGVVFLMFTIGLEFSLPHLFAMRRIVFGLGGLQVLLTMGLVFTLAAALGQDWRVSLALGAILAMSSTAIVSKLLSERLELTSPHGRQIMGVALLQDLAVVPLLILTPALVNPSGSLAATIALALANAVLVLVALLWLGRKLLRHWFHFIARQRSSEIFVLNVLLVTLGLAYATHLAGLPLALGAFLAGMLISETEYRYQVEDYIKPFRDVLLGLFFVSIGMLLDLAIVMENLHWIGLLVVVLLLAKLALVWGLSRLMGSNAAVSLRTALALASAGEFGFVLLAQAQDLLAPSLSQILLAAMIISMVAAPFLIAASDRIVLYFVASEWNARALALHELAVKSMDTERHVIICGYGRSGQSLARLLALEKVPTIALDIDPERVKQAASAGEAVVYGDGARREVLIAAGIHRAAAVAVSFADTATALRILSFVHELEPALPVIVRSYDETDIDRLREAGAAEVVPEILEGSLMLATHTLLLLGTPLTHVLKLLREVRRERYQLMRGFFHGATDAEDAIGEAAQPRLQSILLSEAAYAVGKRLADLELEKLGVQVNALRRRSERGIAPRADTLLETNDVVVLLGLPENLVLAEERLLQG